jgi:ElaB/YqjD/DUF883 family membrane-anchored ribosome-binding protein
MANENEPDPEQIRKQMEETRTALTEKLEALENQVADTVKSATEAVSEATETVKETVESVTEGVKETVESVTEGVKGTVETVADTFNLSRQMEKRPWLILGGSVALGCAVGYLLGGRSHRYRYYQSQPTPPPAPPRESWTSSASSLSSAAPSAEAYRAPEPPRSRGPSVSGWFGEQLSHLKGLAVSTLMGAVRDLAVRNLPESLTDRVSQELDQLTRRMGGEPIQGHVLPEESGHDEGRREGNGLGRHAQPSGQEAHGSAGPHS